MKRAVRQLIVGASKSDAITNMALASSREISDLARSEVFAFHPVGEDLKNDILNVRFLPEGDPHDVFVYHASYGIPEITHLVRNRRDRVVLVYHNITPSDRYWDYDPTFAAALEWGRYELSLLRQNVTVAIADSEYNASELRSIGYRDVRVVPAGLNPHRLSSTLIDAKFNRELGEHFPDGFILFVSQVIPHKRVELAIEIVHLLKTVHRLNVGLVVAGPMRNQRYRSVVERFRDCLPGANVLFTGEVTEEMLATLYRRALLLVGTSDHEGLGIPPLEAMAEGCPVVIRGSGAVPETVGSGAIVLDPETSVLDITEVVAAVIQSAELRTRLVRVGHSRIGDVNQQTASASFRDVMREVLK